MLVTIPHPTVTVESQSALLRMTVASGSRALSLRRPWPFTSPAKGILTFPQGHRIAGFAKHSAFDGIPRLAGGALSQPISVAGQYLLQRDDRPGPVFLDASNGIQGARDRARAETPQRLFLTAEHGLTDAQGL
ncbi:hypothetical protein [Geothrix terrae]|uniref:hypothetical protein n=1 Tax=Geothrix terrae TaxID=2922720 RepID=UPI001FAD3129|nr:hypothetical protein [Geothrix terrae]